MEESELQKKLPQKESSCILLGNSNKNTCGFISLPHNKKIAEQLNYVNMNVSKLSANRYLKGVCLFLNHPILDHTLLHTITASS